MKCAVIGGTGWQGMGVAVRVACAGHTALVGSRDLHRAQWVCRNLPDRVQLPPERFQPRSNWDAARECDLAFVTVPISAHRKVLEEIQDGVAGKIVVDVTAPVDPRNQTQNLWPPEGSALDEARSVLADRSPVVGALKNVSAVALLNYRKPSACDVLVTGADLTAKHRVIGLLREMGFPAYDVGDGEVNRTVEGLTSLLIYINFAYHFRQAGLKVSQLEPGLDFIPDDDWIPPK